MKIKVRLILRTPNMLVQLVDNCLCVERCQLKNKEGEGFDKQI